MLLAQTLICCSAAGIALEHAYAMCMGFDHWLLTVLHTATVSIHSSEAASCTPEALCVLSISGIDHDQGWNVMKPVNYSFCCMSTSKS